ncbi:MULTISPECIES: sulfurtransferase [Bacillus]|uniref:Sulfurtransferase n=2 Tax=Bacillus cereus group TaxID=86661 RepID=A0A2A7DGB8_BACAN|nr:MULTISPECIES: sulfurtransferase [Bacillus]MCP1162932.1 sulfurtransferase [Bacillus sp. 1813sda1]OTW68190.1 sulfurtransferase [Bacillus thuringiensis serovar coreanensis]OTX44807.1 sulfurtransferase [Bacillus thuringiensis serovar sooncheon]OTX53971.1 sulfurtransferase [Bacillus thuringiensis serovar guiyangiensis]OTX68291.1 sulfurtransferase [Bacillus thuringiensis serovar roskildiensis]
MIVTVEWLREHIEDENVRIIDCRFDLANPNWGREKYEEEHIPRALYFDLNLDLSSPVKEHGGRHPLPNIEEFADKLSQAGIDEHTTVIAYDSQAGANASRLWWLLNYVGHEKVYILDGGFPAWKENGLPVTKEIPVVKRKAFKENVQDHMLITMETVKENIHAGADVTLIDSREPKRYAGVEELVDPKAGHIPTAVNYFWKDGILQSGQFKNEAQQQERFQNLAKDKETIVYCGSGVTACPNILALKLAGFQNVKLYAGSWSDWISYPENQIAKEED